MKMNKYFAVGGIVLAIVLGVAISVGIHESAASSCVVAINPGTGTEREFPDGNVPNGWIPLNNVTCNNQ